MTVGMHDLLVVIAKAIESGRDLDSGSRAIAEAAVMDLDDAGYVIRKKPKPRAAGAPRAPKLLPLPTSPGHAAVGKLTDNQRDRMEREWEALCKQAKAEVADGQPSRAEIELRATIALHRSPWTRVSGSRERSNRTYRHTAHPGLTMQETPDGWRLHRDGERLDGPWPTSALAEEAAAELLHSI